MSQTSPVDLWTQNSVLSTRMTSLYWFQPSPVVLYKQYSDYRRIITCLYGSQTSPVLLCMQNSVLSIRITSIYGSQPSSVDLCIQNSMRSSRMTSLYGSLPSSVLSEYKRETLEPELPVSIGPIPQVWFCASRTVCVRTTITGLYGSHTSLVVLCKQNGVFSTWFTGL